MRNTLELNFNNKEKVAACIEELRTVSPVEFTADTPHGPHPRDILTKPEYLEIKSQVRLTFKTQEDCHKFMATSACRETYNKYSN